MTVSEKILEYVKTDRSYSGAVNLYQKVGVRLSLKKQLNVQPESEYMRGVVMEELRQLANINVHQWNYLCNAPLVKKDDITITIADEIKELTSETVPLEVRRGIKIREQYPFLSEEDCPAELKVLVADKLTAYYKYVEAHKKLFDAATEEELSALCEDVVDNYIENRDIYEELEYYKNNSTVLGKHSIFLNKDILAAIRKKPVNKLVMMRGNLRSNISRTQTKLNNEPGSKKALDWKANLERWALELEEVEKMLSLN